jgi:hypothetical protein
VADEILASRFVIHDPFFDGPTGRVGLMISKHCRTCRKDPHRLPDIPIYIEDQKAAENNAVITRWTRGGTYERQIVGLGSKEAGRE